MITTERPCSSKISPDSVQSQSNAVVLDHEGPPPGARADSLARTIGAAPLDTLRDHHLTLALAVIELADAADRPLPWSTDDPTVALLRAATKLALDAPEATSPAAAQLIEDLG